ncbi:MAG: recombinase family protein, partial [Brevinema sp.]
MATCFLCVERIVEGCTVGQHILGSKIMEEKRKVIRAAVYTRKSSEEGLEQEFNSLDAQYEACKSYIESQKHEGWILVDKVYSDGGISGGTMNRPSLKELLKDIEEGHIDLIVVYKIDRLTRSLGDFSKLIEILDRNKAGFVSITQQFNTSTSMGRLTLNMLLSFAQFEREIAGERVRDKKQAMAKRGMWSSGIPPLGYKLENKKIVPDPCYKDLAIRIFEMYKEEKSVIRVKKRLDMEGIY